MIEVLSSEQVQAMLELRRQEFKFSNSFLVLTPLNHVFKFWNNGDVSIKSSSFYDSYQPETANLYNVKYGSSDGDPYLRHRATRKYLYELFINDPECLFFQNWYKLNQELQNRGLI